MPKRLNIHSVDISYNEADPEGFKSGGARLGPLLGATRTGASVYELPTGQSICPYHYEYGEEEWLLVLLGRPTLRVLMFSNRSEPGASVYPDSGKVGVWTGNTDDDLLVERSSGVGYWHGEAPEA